MTNEFFYCSVLDGVPTAHPAPQIHVSSDPCYLKPEKVNFYCVTVICMLFLQFMKIISKLTLVSDRGE